MKINKYTLKKTIQVSQQLNLPFTRKFLQADYFNDEICLWYMVNDNPDSIQEPVNFIVKFTGDEVKPSEKPFYTVVDKQGALVYHIFTQDQP